MFNLNFIPGVFYVGYYAAVTNWGATIAAKKIWEKIMKKIPKVPLGK